MGVVERCTAAAAVVEEDRKSKTAEQEVERYTHSGDREGTIDKERFGVEQVGTVAGRHIEAGRRMKLRHTDEEREDKETESRTNSVGEDSYLQLVGSCCTAAVVEHLLQVEEMSQQE